MLEYYINQPPKPWKINEYDVFFDSGNTSCDDSVVIYLKFDWNILKNIWYEWNLSMISLWSLGFLMDNIIWMNLDDIENLKYDFFASHKISTTPRRQKTLALPLVTIINAIKKYKNKSDELDVEVFAYC